MPRVNGFWFQSARGRAIVRRNAMKAARRFAYRLAQVKAGREWAVDDALRSMAVDGSGLGRAMRYELAVELLGKHITWEVERARRANREWREYRRRHLDDLAAERALDAR